MTSVIHPTRVVLPLGPGPDGRQLDGGWTCEAGAFEIDLDATYTFEATVDGIMYRAMTTRVRHWDAATGIAYLQPEVVFVDKDKQHG